MADYANFSMLELSKSLLFLLDNLRLVAGFFSYYSSESY